MQYDSLFSVVVVCPLLCGLETRQARSIRSRDGYDWIYEWSCYYHCSFANARLSKVRLDRALCRLCSGRER
jgi:L-amino acid N-acyltransferase YncA